MTPGYTFGATEQVTNAKLAQLVSGASLEESEVITANLAALCVTTGKLANSAVTNAKVTQYGLDHDRLTKGTAGQILVADADGVFTAVDPSGALTIDDTGAVTLADDSVTESIILDGAVTGDKIAASSVTPAKISLLVYDTSSSVNSYDALLPGLTQLTEAEAGLEIRLKTQLTNTGPATLTLQGHEGEIRKPGGYPLEVGDVPGGSIAALVWDGAAWQLMSPPMKLEQTERVEVVAGWGSIPTISPTSFTFLRIRAWGAGGYGAGIFSSPNCQGASGGGGAYAEAVYVGAYSVPVGHTLHIAVTAKHARSSAASDTNYRTGVYLNETATSIKTWLCYAAAGTNAESYVVGGTGGGYGGSFVDLIGVNGGNGETKTRGVGYNVLSGTVTAQGGKAGQGIGNGGNVQVSSASGFTLFDGDDGKVIVEYIEAV